MATAIPALAHPPAADVLELPSQLDGVYSSLNDFFTAEFDEADELLAGLHRREVALLVSDEAQGKTHLLLQLSVALAGGQSVLPCSPQDRTPRRILYVNGGEAAASRLQSELRAMLPDIVDPDMAQDNFRILVDTRLHRQPLNLYRDSHWQWFMARLKQQPADLVIVDGMREPLTLTGRSSAAARLDLLRKARQLAADSDCAVLVACTTSSRRRLLGSAQAQTVDTIYTLMSDHRRDEQYRQWRCLQSRWVLPEDLDLQRDERGRGYRLCQAEANANRHTPCRVVAIDAGRESVSRTTAKPVRQASDAPLMLTDGRREEWLPRRAARWQVDERGLEQTATGGKMVAEARIESRAKAKLVASDWQNQVTATDEITKTRFGVLPSVDSFAVPNLSTTDGTSKAENGTLAVVDGTTNCAADAPKKKGGKHGNKRHSKKMRRYR